MFGGVIREAKNGIKELLDKQPNKTLMFKNDNPWIIIEYWEGCGKEEVKGITTGNGFIELICEGFYAKSEDIISSEWLYILECVEYELEEREGRV